MTYEHLDQWLFEHREEKRVYICAREFITIDEYPFDFMRKLTRLELDAFWQSHIRRMEIVANQYGRTSVYDTMKDIFILDRRDR